MERPEDRRKNTRLSIQLEAELHLPGDAVYRGKTKNISFSGVYLECLKSSAIPVVNDPCTLKLILQSGPNPNIISFQCRVVRTDKSGAGIRFISVDMNGYRQFKNLLVYNSKDPDKLLDELNRNPGLDIN
ncbi:MAG: PilZ domain-containing protein [Nitrospiraceae bacterium]|nr:MAG: PilZ domain-containing protein [Nitrospiraceae bacterium]